MEHSHVRQAIERTSVPLRRETVPVSVLLVASRPARTLADGRLGLRLLVSADGLVEVAEVMSDHW